MSTTQNESTLSASERKELDFLRIMSPYLGEKSDECRLVIVIPVDQALLRQNRAETWNEIRAIAIETLGYLRRAGTSGGWKGSVQNVTDSPRVDRRGPRRLRSSVSLLTQVAKAIAHD